MSENNFIPIGRITNWDKIGGDAVIIRHCEHIISHSERYMPERVFEAKEILNNKKNKP